MGNLGDERNHILGIDVGSATVSTVEIDRSGKIVKADYRSHNGNVIESLAVSLENVDFDLIEGVAATGSTPISVLADRRYDDKVSVIAAAARLHEDFAAILLVGAEKFGVLQFDGDGHYRRYRTNTSCAAGTGSFLDQQAARLHLSSAAALADKALSNTEDPPGIASRCAVFARTDLIHAQQEGFGLEAICDGLCRCLARNLVDTLFGSERPEGPVVFCGGVSKNRAVVNHVEDLLGVEVSAGEYSHLYGALGAALSLLEEAHFKYPERLDGILAYGHLLIDAGRPDEARPYLEDVIASDPASPLAAEARLLLGLP